jgi:signal transduction histidine kinase
VASGLTAGRKRQPGAFFRLLLVLVPVVLVCAAAFVAVSVPRHQSAEQAASGVLDLREADFSSGVFALGGEWEFYWGQLYAPDDFGPGSPPGGTLATVPGSWDGEGFPETGFATYRLKILADELRLMLQVPEIASASVVYVNGAKVFEAGVVGRSAAESRMGVRNALVPVPSVDRAAEIVVWVSNYQWVEGGLTQHLEIGRDDVLERTALTRYALLGLFIGAALMMGAYHLVLFWHRRGDRVYLVFGVFCLIVAARFALETNGFAHLLLPGGMGIGLARTYLALFVAQAVALVVFTHEALGIGYGGKLRRGIYAVFSLGPLALTLVAPFAVVGAQWLLLLIIPMTATGVSAARRKGVWRNPYTALFVVSIFIFVVWAPLTKLLLGDLYFVPGITSNLFLIISQCLMLAVSYADTKRRDEELVERNAALDNLNRMKTEFLQNISHEMKTPLAVVSTSVLNADDLLDFDADRAEIRASLRRAQTEVMRMARMVDSAMAFSSANETSQRMEALDLGALLQTTADAYRPLLARHGNTLILNIPDKLPLPRGNSEMLAQVLSNLLSNANRHTQDGKIAVTATRGEASVTVTVRDDGEGVDEAVLPRVFDRGASTGGTGLGLAISKAAIAAHGGRITLRNNSGPGACAEFQLPTLGDEDEALR